MRRILHIIGLLLLVSFWVQAENTLPANRMADADSSSSVVETISTPDLPNIPKAELQGNVCGIHLTASLRAHYLSKSQYLSLVKEVQGKLASYYSHLSCRLRTRLHPSVISYHSLSACGYYIFALRRILI